MKDKTNTILILLLVALAVYGIRDLTKSNPPAEQETAYQEISQPQVVQSKKQTTSNPEASENAQSSTDLTTNAPLALTRDEIRAKFNQALVDAGRCLGLMSSPTSPGDAEPTLENWFAPLKEEIGEPVLQTEDWSAVTLVTANGERRKIRIEMDYSGSDRIVRRLKYTREDQNGSQLIPLSAEQTEEPSETFVASLESDGQIENREIAQRIYFSGGEEVLVTEKNGLIANLVMNRNGRSYQCNLSEAQPQSCKCLNDYGGE